jgi:pilus assembly protein Flp/PilA
MKFINKLFRDEAGATAIEYGLIAALIAVAAITAMTGLGNQLKTTFNTTSAAMSVADRYSGVVHKKKGGELPRRPIRLL